MKLLQRMKKRQLKRRKTWGRRKSRNEGRGGGEYHPLPGILKFCLFFKDSQHVYVIDFGLILLVAINFLSFPCSSSSISVVVVIRGTLLESLSRLLFLDTWLIYNTLSFQSFFDLSFFCASVFVYPIWNLPLNH